MILSILTFLPAKLKKMIQFCTSNHVETGRCYGTPLKGSFCYLGNKGLISEVFHNILEIGDPKKCGKILT